MFTLAGELTSDEVIEAVFVENEHLLGSGDVFTFSLLKDYIGTLNSSGS